MQVGNGFVVELQRGAEAVQDLVGNVTCWHPGPPDTGPSGTASRPSPGCLSCHDYASEVLGPVAPVLTFATPDQAVQLTAGSEYGLSLGILTKDVLRGLDLARPHPDQHRPHKRADRRR